MNTTLAENFDHDYEIATNGFDSTDHDYEIATNSFYSTENTDVANSGAGSKSATAIFLTSLRMLVGILGVLSNLTVCIGVTSMKTNEVKFLIISQAFIDFLTSFVFVTRTVTSRFMYTWFVSPTSQALGYIYCMFWHWDGLFYFLFSISTYNLVAIAIERYMAVLHAIWYRTCFTPKKAMMLGAALWIIAPTMQVVNSATQNAYFDGKCQFLRFTQPYLGIVGVFLFLWDYFVPCLIMGYCFTRIYTELREQDKRVKSLQGDSINGVSTVSGKLSESSADDKKATSRSRNVSKTFLLVYLAFVLCWATNQFLFLQRNLGGYIYRGKPVNHFANSMAILNLTVNPFIYVLRFQQYREKLKQIFCYRCR
ncbi:histamine H2 receptor-like [Amphiura filiformis]|uniref:histamine H2 receptor-like n=1 Tax=Amphiura filiformis TaxID=82378 RepID=UPI003B22473E